MSAPITQLDISCSRPEEKKLESEGFNRVSGNLNSGTTGPTVSLWYKNDGDRPITKIQFSFREEMSDGLTAAGFTPIEKNINTGNKGDVINLWYIASKSQFDIPIVDLSVTTKIDEEIKKYKDGWERLGCDMNRNADGDQVYIWVKRSTPTYVSDLQVSTSFSEDADLLKQGYVRVDEDTNRGAKPQGSAVFIWCRQSTSRDDGIKKIDVSLNPPEEEELEKKHFTKINKNLNAGTNGATYLWFRKDGSLAIQYLTVLVRENTMQAYVDTDCKVVQKNLNYDNFGVPLYIAYGQKA